MSLLELFLLGGVNFSRNLIGIIFRPYETYRRIARESGYTELVYIGLLLTVYFAIASLVKTATFRPFLLTATFVKLSSSAGIGFVLVVMTFFVVSKFIVNTVNFKSLLVSWAYTLIPTLIWFLATSVLYLILPPPRTASVAGITFSLVFIIFSVTLLFWKIILSYLTLRFGLRLEITKILIVTLISLPFVALYSLGMYRLGIFKVPFL